jgi:hypothetical protein
MSPRVIRAFGDRASELLSTMLENIRKPDSPKFIANVSDSSLLRSSLPLFRKELSLRGADFLAETQEAFSRGPRSRSRRQNDEGAVRVSVTVFCHESAISKPEKNDPLIRRRNFRRET